MLVPISYFSSYLCTEITLFVLMILIADSGSTKTDWTLIHSPYPKQYEVITSFQTQGITPIHQSPDDIRQILAHEMMPHLSTFSRAKLVNSRVLETPLLSQIDVCFYGSGCTPVHAPMVKTRLAEVFPAGNIEVHSDLMAAARALCQHEEGIACILGTGANSCLYDGTDIVQNTPALGYILGDEGSGSVLGRLFLNAIFKNPQFADVRDEYLKKTKLTQTDIIEKVYRQPMANRFLGSTAPFIAEHIDNPLLAALVEENFRQFFSHNIVPYQRPDLPVHFVGSIAASFETQLHEAAAKEGFTVGRILGSPSEGLVMYHCG